MSVPGKTYRGGDGELCETCLERNPESQVPAEFKIQGETDSFGCEYIYVCKQHKDEMDEEEENRPPEPCPICKEVKQLSFYRCPEEGNSGPVYEACSSCIRDINNRFIEDMGYDDYEPYEDYDTGWDYDLEEPLEEEQDDDYTAGPPPGDMEEHLTSEENSS